MAMNENSYLEPGCAWIPPHRLQRMGYGGWATDGDLRPRPYPQRAGLRCAGRGAGGRLPHRLPRSAGPWPQPLATGGNRLQARRCTWLTWRR